MNNRQRKKLAAKIHNQEYNHNKLIKKKKLEDKNKRRDVKRNIAFSTLVAMGYSLKNAEFFDSEDF